MEKKYTTLTTYYNTFKTVFLLTVFTLLSSMVVKSQITTYTYNYTGAVQTITVPQCVGTITITAKGAAGGNGYTYYSNGGPGGQVVAVIPASPGAVMQIYVGGAGGNASSSGGGSAGYNGGGIGKTWSSGGGGGGGGATDIRISPYGLNDRIVVAGGGGGAAYNYSSTDYDRGGSGGTTTGGNGYGGNSSTGTGIGIGFGGGTSAGGNGGTYTGYCTAASGSFGIGAAGGGTCSNTGGGGGGGWYGGGGGVWAGGGGGSNYAVSTASSVVHTQGAQAGNGTLILSFQPGFYVAPMVSSSGGNTICAGSTVNLFVPSPITFTGYVWNTGATTASITVTPTAGQVYTMTATNSTCTAVSFMTVTTISSVPSLSIVSTATNAGGVCETKTVTLTASGAVTYTWAGLNNVTNGVPFTPTVTSDYTVSGQNVCGISTATASIIMHPNPTLSIAPLTGSLCSGNTSTISVSGNYVTNTITTAVSAPQVTANVSFTPAVTNTYIVTGTSAQGCTVAANTTLQVVQTPTLAPTSTTLTLCSGKTATLSASGASGYVWMTGSSTIATTSTVAVNPTTPTTYTITKNNSTCFDTQTITINTATSPTIGAIALTGSICSGNTTTITVTGNSISNTITTAVTAPQVTNNVGFQPAVTNTYIATGLSSSGCTANATASVLVVQTPTLAPTSSTLLLCLGKSATLTATGATGGYTWTTGTTTLSTTSNTLQITPNTTTTYSVTKNSSTCFDTKPITIQVNSLTPTFASAASTVICASRPTTLSAFGGVAYTWYSSAAPTTSFSSASNPIISPSVNTTYTVAASDGTCINTAVVSVSTMPNPTINVVTSQTNICIGSAVSLTATGGQGVNYTWTSVPATATLTGQDVISPAFPTPGAYAFSATGDNVHSCTTTAVAVIIVNAAPVMSATATKTLICSGGATTLNVTGASTYQWDSNANNANTATTVVNPSATIVYTVTGTLNTTGCSNSTFVTVNIYTPTLSITSPTNTCYGAIFTLTGSVNNPSSGSLNSYTWTVPGAANSLGTSVQVTPTVLTVYTLSAKSTTMGNITCVESKTTSLGIFYNPTITVAPTRTFVCKNEPIDLVAHGADTYTWNGGSNSGSLITVMHGNVGTVAYTVVGTDPNGCKNDTVFYLKINGCQGIEEFEQNNGNISIYPNPNNGEFNILADKDLKLKLINELGQVIKEFELNAYNAHKVQIADLAKGIYFITGSNNQAVTRQKIIVK